MPGVTGPVRLVRYWLIRSRLRSTPLNPPIAMGGSWFRRCINTSFLMISVDNCCFQAKSRYVKLPFSVATGKGPGDWVEKTRYRYAVADKPFKAEGCRLRIGGAKGKVYLKRSLPCGAGAARVSLQAQDKHGEAVRRQLQLIDRHRLMFDGDGIGRFEGVGR